MNYELIKNFVTVANTRNITRSAEILYVSQSTVSHRLQLLENALGHPLISRGRGKRAAALTDQGKAFLPIAEKWLALWQETETFRNDAPLQQLRVGCVSSLSVCYVSSFIIAFAAAHPNVRISMQVLSSEEIYALMNRSQLDVGIVLTHIPNQSLRVEPLLTEEMVLVCSHNLGADITAIHTNSLDATKEIYLNWGVEFNLWHDYHFPAGGRPQLFVNEVSLIKKALQEWECWSVVPHSVAQLLFESGVCNVLSLKNPPPNRISYTITSTLSNTGISEHIGLFLRELAKYLPASVKYSN